MGKPERDQSIPVASTTVAGHRLTPRQPVALIGAPSGSRTHTAPDVTDRQVRSAPSPSPESNWRAPSRAQLFF